MRGQIRSVYFVLVPLVGTYCLLMGLFPRTLLRLLYGNDYAVTDTVSILILYSINAFLGYMQMVMTAALTAGRRTRSIFAGSAWGCAVALIMSPLCIHYMGINGAIVSIIVTTLLVSALFIVLASRGTQNEPPALLQLHVSTDYQVSDRVVFSGEEILRTRRRSENGLWIPSAGAEFTCVLANRLDKAKLDDARGQILS